MHSVLQRPVGRFWGPLNPVAKTKTTCYQRITRLNSGEALRTNWVAAWVDLPKKSHCISMYFQHDFEGSFKEKIYSQKLTIAPNSNVIFLNRVQKIVFSARKCYLRAEHQLRGWVNTFKHNLPSFLWLICSNRNGSSPRQIIRTATSKKKNSWTKCSGVMWTKWTCSSIYPFS